MLRQCVSLVSLACCIVPDTECHGVTCNTILPVLESLKIATYVAEPCGQFLRPSILPSLKRLEVNLTGISSQWSGMVLPRLIHRSSCRLRRFEATALAPPAVTALLTAAPSFTRLTLFNLRARRYTHNRDFFLAIARGDLVPNLQHFESNLLNLEYVIDPVERRTTTTTSHISPCTPIRTMVIHDYPGEKWHGVQKSSSLKPTSTRNKYHFPWYQLGNRQEFTQPCS